jgi:hypothetical protein
MADITKRTVDVLFIMLCPRPLHTNLLINHKILGDAVAEALNCSSGIDGADSLPRYNVVFLGGHGFCCVSYKYR